MCKYGLDRNLLPLFPYGHRWWHIHLDSLVCREVLEFKLHRCKMMGSQQTNANSFSLLLRLLVESSIRHQIAADSECYSFLSGVKQLSPSDPRIYSQVLKLLRSLHNLVKRPPRHTMNEEETYSRLQAGLNSTAVRSKPEFCIYVPRS